MLQCDIKYAVQRAHTYANAQVSLIAERRKTEQKYKQMVRS